MSQSSVSLPDIPPKDTQKSALTYYSQIVVIYAIIATSIIHLSLQSPDKELWLVLLSSSLGYILPAPTLKIPKSTKNELVLHDPAQ